MFGEIVIAVAVIVPLTLLVWAACRYFGDVGQESFEDAVRIHELEKEIHALRQQIAREHRVVEIRARRMYERSAN